MGALGDSCQNRKHTGIDLAGVSLSRHGVAAGKAHLLRDHGIGLPALLMVAVKKLQEAGLGASGSLRAQKLHGTEHMLQILQVKKQLLQPQGSPLSHGSGLCRLEMGEGKGGLILILIGKLCQLCHHIQELFAHQAQGLGHDDDVRIVSHVAGGGA